MILKWAYLSFQILYYIVYEGKTGYYFNSVNI